MEKNRAKDKSLARRQRRVRAKISGTTETPRLRVIRTNAHISAQIIDDVTKKTLAAASSTEAALDLKLGSNIDAAKAVGEAVGKRAMEAGVTTVVFDRGGRIYHGRVKALADGARSAGLKF